MAKLKNVLLTGANGFIATHIARLLLAKEDVAVFALVRAKDVSAAKAKLEREWWDYPELITAMGTRIHAVAGDVCQPNLGLTPTEYSELVGKVTHIIHTAADWRLLPIEELRKTNVQGTANIIEFAKQAPHLERLSHISTAYVAGGATGTVSEEQLTDQNGFFTNYEQSKYEAELLVREYRSLVRIAIYRPSIVVGRPDGVHRGRCRHGEPGGPGSGHTRRPVALHHLPHQHRGVLRPRSAVRGPAVQR